MTAMEIAAYIGAAAWLPQIASWIFKAYVTPQITIVPDRSLQLGFTSLGPIFNLRMAFSADRKDAIIDSFEVMLKHEDGEERLLRWAGMNETFSEITDSMGNRQVISKEQPAIAFKIGRESLLEKFVRFNEPRFYNTILPFLNELTNHFDFLKKKEADYVSKIMESKQYNDLSEIRKKAFWWKAGKYQATFKLGSPKKITLTHDSYEFQLNHLEVEKLQKNVDALDSDLSNIIKSNLPDFKAEPIDWNWVNVDFASSVSGNK